MATRREFLQIGGGAAAAMFTGSDHSVEMSQAATPGVEASAKEAKTEPDARGDWREEYAYTLGSQAYIYAFPLVYLSQLRYDWTNVPGSSFYASLNHFHHKKILSNHINYTSGGSPNQDTLYSWGWVDMRDGPVVLVHPEMGDRYFTFEIADMFSDNFAYVGKRTTGSRAGAFAIVPHGWKGELPADINGSFQSPTRFALVFGRTLVKSAQDVSTVNQLQQQYHLIPLALWGKSNPRVTEGRDVFRPFDAKSDSLADWKTINTAWAENPLPADREPDLVRLFREIGVGPDFSAESIEALAEPTRRGLARASAAARPMLDEILATGAYKSKAVNGWMYPPEGFGHSGLVGDYAVRAAGQCLGGIISNDAEEAVYMPAFVDGSGQPLVGGRRYTVRFEGGNLPPVNEFWSMSMYGPDNNFVANGPMRYSIGDRTQGLTKDAQGGFTVFVQPDAPSDPAEKANWLPSPSQGSFHLILRNYGPKQPVLDQTWLPPPVLPS